MAPPELTGTGRMSVEGEELLENEDCNEITNMVTKCQREEREGGCSELIRQQVLVGTYTFWQKLSIRAWYRVDLIYQVHWGKSNHGPPSA